MRLDGAWEFHWRHLPSDLAALPSREQPTTYLPVPASWTGQRLGNETLPAEGFATYRLKVLISPNAGLMAVRTDSAGTAFELWVGGKRATGNGLVGRDAAGSIPEYLGKVTVLPALTASSEWMLAVSNFHYRKGGPWNHLELGLAPDLAAAAAHQGQADLFVIGSVLIMGLYHFVLFALRRKDRSALYYGLFCVVIACRQASTGGRMLLDLWPGMPWGMLIRVEFISFFLSVGLSGLFARALFPAEVPRRAVFTVAAVAAVTGAFALLTPVSWSSRLINPYQVWTLGAGAYLLGCVGAAVRHRRDGAALFMVGAGLLILAAANDMLYNLEMLRLAYLVPFGFMAFTFAQAVLLSRRFVTAMNTSETLQGALEQKVEERTLELAAKNVQLEATVEDLRATQGQLRKVGLSVRIGTDYLVFPYAEVHYLTARAGKTVIHTRTGETDVARPLKEIETQLSTEVFQRIHRQCIVNVHHVANMSHIGNGTYMAMLRGRTDAPLPVSRVHAPALKQRLGITD